MAIVNIGAQAAGLSAQAVAPASPAGAVPCAACQTLSVTPGQVLALPDRLAGTKVLLRLPPGTEEADWSPALQDLGRRGAVAGVHLTAVPADDDPTLDASGEALVIEVGPGDPDRLAFDLKRALTAARGRRPATTLLLAASVETSSALRARGLDSYIDGFVLVPIPIATPEELLTPGSGLEFRPGASTPDERLRLDPRVVWLMPAEPEAIRAIARAAADLQSWLPAGLVAVAGRVLTCGEGRPLRVLLNPRTLDLVAVSRSCPAPAVVTSDVPGATTERMDLGQASVFRVRADGGDRFAADVDVAAARPLAIDEVIARHQAAAARQTAGVATSIATGSLTLTFEAPGFVAPITVTSKTTIFTEKGLETKRLETQPPETQGPRDQGRIDLQQREVRVNGVLLAARGGVPRLPIIEPERAAAPPLAITLSDVYRYRLVGRESLNGRDSYVVAFTPRDRRAPLYEGRAWIDRATFGMARVSAAQTGLKGPITASEQDDDFTAEAGGRWRLARSNVRQTYEGASVRTPVHRLLIIDQHEVNPSDFAVRRAAAYASNDVMLRDTPEGYRYLKKEDGRQKTEDGRQKTEDGRQKTEDGRQKTEGGGQKTDEAGPATEGRVLAGRADRIRTLAFGVIVDPNISRPLPFAGLSYVDFNLFGTGAQFSGFFGGSYGQLAFSAPSLRGSRWQLAGRAFGIASSYNDRAFEGGREQYTLDIRQRPAQAAVWLLRPLSARTALRLEYDWDYTKFGAGDLTDPGFTVPRNQNAHAVRAGLDLQRAGWQGTVWGSYGRRVGWRRWGLADAADYRPGHADYQRYGATLLRSQALSPRVTTRIEAAVMGGRDLDRFSRFAFGTFDNRLHGYPSALVRYDRGAVLRTAVAWSAAKALRLDAFVDTAEVRDPGFGPKLRNFTGFGAAVETPAPFGTLIAAEWGFGVQGVNTTGGRGTHVVRISGYKVF